VRIVAILNQKGGVGKTTTAVNLGAALATNGRRVLLVDADPQCNLTDHLGLDPTALEQSIYDVLVDDAPLASVTQPTGTEGLFVLPAHPDLAAAEQELASEIARESRLRRAFATLPADAYEWVLIDCPPSLGLLSLNAMVAATEIIITVQTEYFAMRGLGQIDEVIGEVQRHINRDLEILGILPTLVNPVTRLAREVLEEVRRHFGHKVFTTRIRQNVRLAEAPGHQQHIFDYDPESAGAADYRALADEIQARAPAVKPVGEGETVGEAQAAAAERPSEPPPSADGASNGSPASVAAAVPGTNAGEEARRGDAHP
jgi:chromosome partitioning protein